MKNGNDIMKTKDIAKEIKELGIPVIIWGYWTQTTQYAAWALEQFGVEIEAYLQTDQKQIPKVEGKLITESILNNNYPEYVMIKGYIEHLMWDDSVYYNRFSGCKRVYEIIDSNDMLGIVEPYDDDFAVKNHDKLKEIKSAFCDELSVISFDAFIKLKVEGDNTEVKKHLLTRQYFFEDAPWILSEKEFYLDCGAYDGDSIRSFIEATNFNGGGIIAFEPDTTTYQKLVDYLDSNSIDGVKALRCGVGEKKARLSFNGDGSSSAGVREDGKDVIDVVAIDDIVSESGFPVTIIKMDIEGMEISALKGAAKSIKEYRPILMICAYHKKNDLIDIYDTVNSMVEDYCWYFRCHSPITNEGVYYIVPKERVNN